jgi:uncharacterized delta-60 repeat protein
LALAPASLAAPGDLDPSFGSGGTMVTDFGGEYGGASAVAIQADGKIVVVGSTGNIYEDRSIAVARYNPDGSLDSTFDEDGMQTTDVGGGFDSGAWGVAIQPDGKIVVVGVGGGVGSEHAMVVRYAVDGSLDPTFSGDGIATLDFRGAWAVVFQPDGKILVGGGTVSTTAPHNQYGFARFTSTGNLDPTFSGDGIQTVSITGLFEDVAALELDSAGRIIAGGRTETDWGLMRLTPDGELDSTFSEDGKQRTDFGGTYDEGSDNLTDLVVQADGRIVAVGWKAGSALFARYGVDGTLDASFPQTTTHNELSLNAVALQADGKVVTAGVSMDGLFVARRNGDGLIDQGFGGGTIAIAGHGANDMAIQADGSIVVVAGRADAEFGVLRLEGGDGPVIPLPDTPALPAPPVPPATPPAAPKLAKPTVARLMNLKLSKTRITARQRATISFRLSAPARVTIKAFKTKAGVRKGKRCVKPGKSNSGKRCDLPVQSLKRSLGAGPHTLKLPKVEAGRYRVAISTDAKPPQGKRLPLLVKRELRLARHLRLRNGPRS